MKNFNSNNNVEPLPSNIIHAILLTYFSKVKFNAGNYAINSICFSIQLKNSFDVLEINLKNLT